MRPRLPYLEERQRAFAVCRSAEVFEEETFTASDGTPLTVLHAGDPRMPAVLLINALGMSCLFLAELARRLSRDYRVITWESRGLPDESTLADDGDLSLARHCRDVAEILAHRRLQPKGVVAYCSGSNVAALALATGAVTPQALCIISPSMRIGNTEEQTDYQRTMLPLWEKTAQSGPRYAALVRVLLDQGLRSDDGSVDWELASLNHLPFRSNTSTHRYARLQTECLQHDWREILGRISVPTLVLHGRADDVIHCGTSAAVARALAGEATLRLIATGHFGVYQSGRLHDAVAEFFRENILDARHRETTTGNAS